MNSPLLVSRHGAVAIFKLNRPEVRNAINGELAAAIAAAWHEAEADAGIHAVVITGEGSAFCAGADLKAVDEAARKGIPNGIIQKRGGFAGLVRLDRRKPLVAAIQGHAYAGGFEIALACDLVVACEQATFALPEVKRSLIASAGALFRLPRVVGLNRAMELILIGDPINARRANEIGIVNRLVDAPQKVLPTAIELAERVARNAPMAVQASRNLALAAFDTDDEGLFRSGFKEANAVLGSEDAVEGRRAFLERRPPHWKGT